MNTEVTKKIVSVIVIVVVCIIIGMVYSKKQVDQAIKATPPIVETPNVPVVEVPAGVTVSDTKTTETTLTEPVTPLTEPVKLEAGK